jgi:hypothetical protein
MEANGQNIAINILNPALATAVSALEALLQLELVNSRYGLQLGLFMLFFAFAKSDDGDNNSGGGSNDNDNDNNNNKERTSASYG